MKKKILFLLTFLMIGCGNSTSEIVDNKNKFYDVEITKKEISKDEYLNKTLGGLLGQFVGFLSGYEFVFRGAEPYVGMPLEWFSFINGPYAGNFTHYTPSGFNDCYNRLVYNNETNMYEVWSDDDFHIDIFNQLIIDEFGTNSYAIKEAWKKYVVSDWGGGGDAMNLINKNELLSPFTGTIEAGNRYGWCTEAYIENETLGMNAPGMVNVATSLIDKFASNVGYFDSIVWAKFYGAMYSLAYFETDVVELMEKAKEVLPNLSYPKKMYDYAFEAYNKYPNDYQKAAIELTEKRRMLYRIDNIQTDPNVNGGFAILSWLYGKNSYLETCKYASMIGYDGDCTAAITQGIMGILKGFKESNEEYSQINEKIYYNGKGIYYNDKNTGYPPHIKGDYPTRQKIDDIVKLYQTNFEKILLENGGEILKDSYLIPTTNVYKDHSYLFENYDAENRDTSNYESKNGTLQNILETENINSHSGYAYFQFNNLKNGEVYHKFDNLIEGRYYRLTSYVKTSTNTQVKMFARSNTSEDYITFSNINSIINQELIFKATSKTMDMGFKFEENQAKDSYVIFDDYLLEEINREEISSIQTQDIKLFSSKYLKTISKPENIKIGQEVILSLEVRNYTSSTLFLDINRNNKRFGGAIVSNSSINSISGKTYLEIPYVFEKNSDVIQLSFNGKLGIGNINIYNTTQYMFR